MPETKRDAIARAKQVHIPVRQVVKAKRGGYFIAPRGVKHKHAYAEMRARGYSKAKAAKIAHHLDRGTSRKHK